MYKRIFHARKWRNWVNSIEILISVFVPTRAICMCGKMSVWVNVLLMYIIEVYSTMVITTILPKTVLYKNNILTNKRKITTHLTRIL